MVFLISGILFIDINNTHY